MVQFIIIVGGLGMLFARIMNPVRWHGRRRPIRFRTWPGDAAFNDSAFFSFSPFERLTLWGLVLFVVNEQLFFNTPIRLRFRTYQGTSSYKQAKRSMFTFVLLSVPATFALWLLGLAIFSFYGTQPNLARPVSGDLALYEFISTQLPSPIPGLIVAALLAKGMSTLAGGLNNLDHRRDGGRLSSIHQSGRPAGSAGRILPLDDARDRHRRRPHRYWFVASLR